MTIGLWITVWQSLIMGFAFLVPLALCRIADIAFGTLTAFKVENLKFDIKKFLTGILSTIIMLIGLAALIAGITMIPELLDFYQIKIVDTEALGEVISVLMVISTIVVSAFTYGKDAYGKFKLLLSKNETNSETNISPVSAIGFNTASSKDFYDGGFGEEAKTKAGKIGF